MTFVKWLKVWGTLVVSLLAVIVSTVAILVSCRATSLENVHYQELTKPLAEHTQLYNTLTRLDNRIEVAEQGIAYLQSQAENVSAYKERLFEARLSRDQAELLWVKGNYTEASKFVNRAYELMQEIPLPPVGPGTNWGIILGIIVAVIVIVVIVSVVIRPKAVR